MSSLISCVTWVSRGAAARHPVKYDLDEKELERISALARIELEDARVELARASVAAESMRRDAADEADDDGWEDQGPDDDDGEGEGGEEGDRMDVADVKDEDGADVKNEDGADVKNEDGADAMEEDVPPDPDDLSAYRLDEYDDGAADAALGPFSNIKGLTYYRNNEEDPYITLKEGDDEERAELEVLPSDNLLVAAKTEDDISHLEVYVFDEAQDSLYVHHDIMLPSFPLCLEWLDFHPAGPASAPALDPSLPGNYVAVGTMDPEIELWPLDTLDAIYPASVLGRPDLSKAHTPVPLGTGKKKRKKTKARCASSAHHVDAVLGLAWNKTHRNLLASASADATVKLWDLSRATGGAGDAGGALRSFAVHTDKVQSVQWNPREPTVLLTGSYDRTVRTFDSRAPDVGLVAVLGADVEALRWDPWDGHGFYVSLENGLVLNYDARTLPSDNSSLARPRFTLAAHDGAASALDVNPHLRGCLVTGGTDKIVKVWNVLDGEGDGGKREVSLVTSRDLGVGKVFSAVFSPDDPLTIAAAGSKAKVQIWDIGANAGVRKTFGKKLAEAAKTVKERTNGGLIGVVSDEEDASSDDDD